MIVDKEGLEDSDGQQILASESSDPTKNASCSVAMVNSEEEDVSAVWFEKVLLIFVEVWMRQ